MKKLMTLSITLFATLSLAACSSSNASESDSAAEDSSNVIDSSKKDSSKEDSSHSEESEPTVEESSSDTDTEDEDSSSDSASDKVSIEYQNALNKATSYANRMHMSKQGVYDQLTSEYGEKFSAAAADYAVNHLSDVDWNANALAKAKSYQKRMHMSNDAVRDQLTSSYGEKFTDAEAAYAVNHLN